VFFANRRPGFLDRFGLSSHELAVLRPGIVHVDMSIYGPRGPWANRIGFDQIAGAVTGVLALEGTAECPKLPEVFVVNDYVTSWFAAVGAIAALRRRAVEGGSYRVRISLARLSLWLLQLGIFDKAYARRVARTLWLSARSAWRQPAGMASASIVLLRCRGDHRAIAE
jgi:crotonobetainyl-CoA:carnitine CoA-transferase CaiB-like acyl-CoA transferase